ncbi:MAG: hypothetical protein KDA65_11140 [Planctomycetaceae bacterium]|nr:hypothetical protein [Planctomycetaceae bacterium]
MPSFKPLFVTSLSYVLFTMTMLVMCSSSLHAQSPGMASVEPEGAGWMKFKEKSDWDQLPEYIDPADFYVTNVKSKRDKYPEAINLVVNKPGMVLLATPASEPPPLENASDETNESFKFVPPEELVSTGWEPVGVATQNGLPQVLMRKNFDGRATVPLKLQRNLGPMIFNSTKSEFAQTLASLPAKKLDELPLQSPTVAVTETTSNSPGDSPAPPNSENTSPEGTPNMQPPPGGGLLGTLFGLAKTFTGDGPPPIPGNIPPGDGSKPIGPPPGGDGKKMAFIQSVSLDNMKCPVEREQVDRKFHADYRGGVVFFSSQEAQETFLKDTDQHSAAANYQLFLTGQAIQERCPISNNSFEEKYSMNVGYGKSVYFNSSSELRRLNGTQASYKLNKIFGNTAFERAFDIAIPDALPKDLDKAFPFENANSRHKEDRPDRNSNPLKPSPSSQNQDSNSKKEGSGKSRD